MSFLLKRFFVVIFLFFVILKPFKVWGHDNEYIDRFDPILKFADETFPELVLSSRALGTGNAYSARVDDGMSAFYNPAGLGSVRWIRIHPVSGSVESSEDLSEASTLQDGSGGWKMFRKGLSLDGMRAVARENREKLLYTRTMIHPHFTWRYLSAGYYFSRRIMAYAEKNTDITDTAANFDTAFRRDRGVFGAMNLSFFGGVIKVGASAMGVDRKEIYGTLPINIQTGETKVVVPETQVKAGKMTNIIVGGRITLPITFLPTFSGVLHNAANSKFWNQHGNQAPGFLPDPIEQQIDVGFSFSPQVAKMVRFHFEGNYKDVGGAHSHVSSDKKWTAGIEMDVARVFFMRAGYGARNASGSIGLRTRWFVLELTTYGADVMVRDHVNVHNRRYLGHFAMGF